MLYYSIYFSVNLEFSIRKNLKEIQLERHLDLVQIYLAKLIHFILQNLAINRRTEHLTLIILYYYTYVNDPTVTILFS